MAEKTCVITGASRGIGLAIAERFARAGWNVAAVGRTEADLDAAIERLSPQGAGCLAVVADVSEPDDAREIVDSALERFGRIDVLVNNAGCAPLAPIEQFTPDDFEMVFAINIAGVFNMTRTVWPHMKSQGGGVIVNISSLAALDPFPGFAVYGASKAWVNTFTQAVAQEGKAHGIRVYSVAPGAVETSLLRSRFPEFPKDKTLAPDEVAAVVEAVCEARMAPASGQTVFVRK